MEKANIASFMRQMPSIGKKKPLDSEKLHLYFKFEMTVTVLKFENKIFRSKFLTIFKLIYVLGTQQFVSVGALYKIKIKKSFTFLI